MHDLILLIGGKGTRLKHLTKKTPKCLIDINGKPFLNYLFKQYEDTKIKNIYLCTQYKSIKIKNYVKQYNSKKLNIKIFNDGSSYLGTGGSIKKILNKINDNFFVQNGDTFLRLDYEKLYNFFEKDKSSVICYSNFKSNTLNNPNLKTNKTKVLRYSKKNYRNNNSIDAGLYIFKKNDFKNYHLNSFDLSLVINRLIRLKKIRGFKINKTFFEIGGFEGISAFHKYLIKNN